jgi:hypothetical protein
MEASCLCVEGVEELTTIYHPSISGLAGMMMSRGLTLKT